jgi:hypothetical protein
VKRKDRTSLFVVAAAALAAVIAGSGAAKTSPTVTFHLVEKSLTFHFVDTPPFGGENQPPSQGDSFVFTSELLTRARKHAGMLRAVCHVTAGGRVGALTCFGTFGLKGGQLEGMATIRGEPRRMHIAIVGGTGVYVGVRGEVVSVQRGEDSPFSDDTFRLFKP